MRLRVFLALTAAALAAGCATSRCGSHDCCVNPAPVCTAQAPGRCVVTPDCCLGPMPEAPQAVPAPAPTPIEPAPAPPAPPMATMRPSRPVQPEIDELETQPVSTAIPDTNYGNDPEYTWLLGQLQRVHVPGGEWKLRYAPLDQVEHWGGSVVLATDIRLDAYTDGDIVYVEGEILAARPSLYLSGPLYRIRTIRPATARDRERVARNIP